MDRSLGMLVAVVLAPSLALVACVSKTKYDAAIADAQQAHAQLTNTEAELGRLRSDLDAAEAQMQARDQR